MIVFATIFIGVGAAPATVPVSQSNETRFSLNCESQNPKAPIRTYAVDVNLDQRSYYVDSQFGGPDEVDSVQGDQILFRRHGNDVHGLPMFTLEQFDRKTGGWYFFGHSPDGKPDAICKTLPPRQNFMADRRYNAPNR